MPQRTLNLFESATSRARVIRQGEIVQIVIDGGGAFVTFMQEFNLAKKWATPKTATGNMITDRSEEHTSELQSLMRISYAVFCLKKKKRQPTNHHYKPSNLDNKINTKYNQ